MSNKSSALCRSHTPLRTEALVALRAFSFFGRMNKKYRRNPRCTTRDSLYTRLRTHSELWSDVWFLINGNRAHFLADMITGNNLMTDYSWRLQAQDKDALQKVKATADAWRSIPGCRDDVISSDMSCASQLFFFPLTDELLVRFFDLDELESSEPSDPLHDFLFAGEKADSKRKE